MDSVFECFPNEDISHQNFQLLQRLAENHQRYEKFVSGVYQDRLSHLVYLFNQSEAFRKKENLVQMGTTQGQMTVQADPRLYSNSTRRYIYVPSFLKDSFKPDTELLMIINQYISQIDQFYTFCAFPSLKHLKSFTFCNIELKNDVLLVLLCRGISSLINLETLNISNCKVPKLTEGKDRHLVLNIHQFIRIFALSLLQLPKIKDLSLMNNNFMKVLMKFSAVFGQIPDLTFFRFGGNKRKKKNFESKEKVLFDCISLCRNRIAGKIEAFSPSENLSCLYFENLDNRLDRLKVLHLRKINNFPIQLLGKICSSSSLEDIDLSYNHLSGNCLGYINKADDSKVKTLQLSGNFLGSVTFYELIQKILDSFPRLDSLALDKNNIHELGVSELGNFFNLKHLVLDKNHFNHFSLDFLPKLSQSFPNLLKISMKKCRINNKTFFSIFEQTQLKGLELDLRNNGILGDITNDLRIDERYSSIPKDSKIIRNWLKDNSKMIQEFKCVRINSTNLLKRNEERKKAGMSQEKLLRKAVERNLTSLTKILMMHPLKAILY